LETPGKTETSDIPEKTETADPPGQTPATEEKPDYEDDEGWLPWV